ncbi:hypothetical protein P4408_14215 [Bacillus thuringiensis]
MGRLDDFISEFEQEFNVKVNDAGSSYSPIKSWDPMQVVLNPEQFQKFINTFGSSGKYSGAQYEVVRPQVVNFFSLKGETIIDMLRVL